MANYKALTPNPNLLFEQNIYDNKELQTYINAIKDGERIKLSHYIDGEQIFIKLDRAGEDEPIIQTYISFGGVDFFKKRIVDYCQFMAMAWNAS